MTRKTLLAAVLLTATALAHAEDGFSGEAALGFLSTSGNTDTRTLNAKLAVAYKQGQWGHSASAIALNGSKDDVTTDERYALAYKATYDFTAHDYWFGSLGYDKDRFAGFSQRSTEAVGYGRRLLTLPKHMLDAEIGAGLTQLKARDGTRSNSAVGLLNGKYQWLVSETTTFTQTLKVEQSKDNTYVNPVSQLKLVISGNLFATIGYELRYNSEVPVGLSKTDTLSSVNLGYSFK